VTKKIPKLTEEPNCDIRVGSAISNVATKGKNDLLSGPFVNLPQELPRPETNGDRVATESERWKRYSSSYSLRCLNLRL
jgi:hypothetical protein